MEREVEQLAERFLEGHVSLFLGAGVSVNAGLPSWAQVSRPSGHDGRRKQTAHTLSHTPMNHGWCSGCRLLIARPTEGLPACTQLIELLAAALALPEPDIKALSHLNPLEVCHY